MIDMWSCFQVVEALEIAPPAEEKYMECIEEISRLPHVVNFAERDDNYVVRKIKQQGAENCFIFLPLQVLYCNLES